MKHFWLILLCVMTKEANGQYKLQPAFDAREYTDLLSLAFFSSSIPNSYGNPSIRDPYKMVYRSNEVGFNNRWTLYLRDDNIAVIDIRGTVNNQTSWMANFYAAMIPATGNLQLNDSTVFEYQLASNPNAMVHVGWTVALAYLAPDIERKINEYATEKKVKEFLVMGHSQGAAIAFLLRSYLEYEKQKGKIQADLLFKTYCSAAPKPGNLYYVYDFDFITRKGWAYTIVNTADWVPEMPFSIQTMQDINIPNPIVNARTYLKKQKFIVRSVGNRVYDKLERKPRKAQRKYEKYAGHVVYKRAVKKILPQLKEPVYAHGNNYMRAGIPIILVPDEIYRQKFPETPEQLFLHHGFQPYYDLALRYYLTR